MKQGILASFQEEYETERVVTRTKLHSRNEKKLFSKRMLARTPKRNARRWSYGVAGS